MKAKLFKNWLLFACLISWFSVQVSSPNYYPARQALVKQGEPKEQVVSFTHQLVFEANQGQVDPKVKFMIRGRSVSYFLTSNEVVMKTSEPAGMLRLYFIGANLNPDVSGQDLLPGIVNSYTGADPAGWRAGIPTYAKVYYPKLYPQINAMFYGNNGHLEHDLTVEPGGRPDSIQMGVEGAQDLRLDSEGNLLMIFANRIVTMHRPFIYQQEDGKQHKIDGGYLLKGDLTFGYVVDAYNPTLPLTIDPVIDFSTYFGGTSYDVGYGIAVDPAGNIYLTGATNSPDFPGTNGGFHANNAQCPSDLPTRDCYDVFVTKINAAGTAIMYSTYLGYPGEDEGHAIAVDQNGNAYITGLISMGGPPPNENIYIYKHALVVKLDGSGGMIYGYAWGESSGEIGHGIAVDSLGQAYVTGEAFGSILITPDALQPEKGEMSDGFLSVFSADGTQLVYSTYLGGNGTYCDVCESQGLAVAVDNMGKIYVTGRAAPSFPTTPNAYRSTFDGFWEAFVAKIDPTQAGMSGLVYSTYLGGVKTDDGVAIAVDGAGKVYLTGTTDSDDFPTTVNAFDRVCGTDGVCNPITVCDPNIPPRCYTDPKTDIFVSILDPSKSGAASLLYSTYIGGAGQDISKGIAIDGNGNTFVTGYTWSPDFPMVNPLDNTYGANDDIILFQLAPDGSMPFSTYIGGGGVDHAYALAFGAPNRVYLTGNTGSAAFPVVNPLVPRTNSIEAFITRVILQSTPPAAFNKSAPGNGATGQPTNRTLSWGTSTGAASYDYCYDTTNDNTCSNWINTTATSVTLNGLSNSTTYYWQVRANNSGGTTYANGSETAFWSFTTVAAAPGAFNKSAPANGAIDQSTNRTLSWGTSSGAASYDYCYDTTNDNACASWVSIGATTSANLNGLSNSTTYYWQVRANNASGTTYANGSATAFWSFTTTDGMPGAFTKSTPTNGAINQPTFRTLSWGTSSGATSYEYCYDTTNDSNCAGWVSTTTTSVSLNDLSYSTTYYWQVRAVNGVGKTDATDGWFQFTTIAKPDHFLYLPCIRKDNP